MVGTSHRPNHPHARLFSVVTLALEQPAWRRAPRRGMTRPALPSDAIALVRRHLWVQQGAVRAAPIKVPRLYHMLDTLAMPLDCKAEVLEGGRVQPTRGRGAMAHGQVSRQGGRRIGPSGSRGAGDGASDHWRWVSTPRCARTSWKGLQHQHKPFQNLHRFHGQVSAQQSLANSPWGSRTKTQRHARAVPDANPRAVVPGCRAPQVQEPSARAGGRRRHGVGPVHKGRPGASGR